jgi:glutamate racemase
VVFTLNPCKHLQGRLMTTGSLPALQAAAARWLALPASCCASVAVPDLTAPAAL